MSRLTDAEAAKLLEQLQRERFAALAIRTGRILAHPSTCADPRLISAMDGIPCVLVPHPWILPGTLVAADGSLFSCEIDLAIPGRPAE